MQANMSQKCRAMVSKNVLSMGLGKSPVSTSSAMKPPANTAKGDLCTPIAVQRSHNGL